MDNDAIKEARRVLRMVQAHLADAHLRLGAKQDHIGLVDVIHHPQTQLPHLNYAMPRRNTAWVPGPEIQRGLEQLRRLERAPRVNYVEGLYPPLFARTLRDLGLEVEQETPIMLFKLQTQSAPEVPALEQVDTRTVSDQEGIALWWYVYRNAFYDVITRGVEPISIGKDMAAITRGEQTDILLYRHNFPVGAARLTYHAGTAHLASLAIMREHRSQDMLMTLYRAAITAADEHDCELIFTSGDTDSDRALLREAGFMDSGSIVCYAESAHNMHGGNHGSVAQPLSAV